MIRMIENHKFLMFFFGPLKSKIESPRRRNANFHSWVTRLPIEIDVHVANIFWRLLQIPAFCLLASKIRISNSSPLQGRRVNRLPCFSIWRRFFRNHATFRAARCLSNESSIACSNAWHHTSKIKQFFHISDIKGARNGPEIVNLRCLRRFRIYPENHLALTVRKTTVK